MMRVLAHQPFTVVFAVLTGLLAAPLLSIATTSMLGLYDAAFPVATMRGEFIKADQSEVVIRISGIKHRACTYLRLQALVRDASGNYSDAHIHRIDITESGGTKAPGSYYLGEWRIWPRGQAVAVVVNSNHLCGTRLVVTKIAEVDLQ